MMNLRVEELEGRDVPSISIRFDFSYDQSGFFNDPTHRAALQRASDAVTPYLNETLASIQPGNGNTWQASFVDPLTNSTINLNNPSIGQNELVVYIAGGQLNSSELGLTTSGGFSASGSADWLNLVKSRGTSGNDFSSWGGMISFSNDSPWYFGSGNPSGTQYDFTSVAEHELLHILGFGMGETAFTRNVTNWDGSNGLFNGPTVVALMGRPVALTGDGGTAEHWAPGTSYQGAVSPVVPSLQTGVKHSFTPLDFAALNDLGWQVAPAAYDSSSAVSTSPGVNTDTSPQSSSTGSAALTTAPGPRFAVGTANGAIVYGANGQRVLSSQLYESDFTGGVRVATGDLNGDGYPDLVAVSGPGRPVDVVILDGRTGNELLTFRPFESTFTGGGFVSIGDLDGSGHPEVIVTPDQGGGPVVAVYDGRALAQGQPVQQYRFLGINDPNFRGGARVAVGSLGVNGKPELLVAAGFGGGPRLSVYDGGSVMNGTPTNVVGDFFVGDSSLRNGVYIALGDENGDGVPDLIVGAGPSNGPRVTIYDGRDLLHGQKTILADFFAGNTADRGGASVAVSDLSQDGRPDVVIGAGTGSSATVSVYTPSSILSSNPIPQFTIAGQVSANSTIDAG